MISVPGNAGISQLRQVRFDRLKTDKSLGDCLTSSEDGRALAHTFLGLGRLLKVPVTAKGIKCEDVVPELIEQACSEGQGYAFGRAVPAEAVFECIGNAVRNEAV